MGALIDDASDRAGLIFVIVVRRMHHRVISHFDAFSRYRRSQIVTKWKPGVFGATPPLDERRLQMVRETSAFLTWAVKGQRDMPRIPTRRVDEGGYDELMRRPGARAAAAWWWARALDCESLEV